MAEGVETIIAKRGTPREGESPRPRPEFTPASRWIGDHQRALRDKNLTLGILLAGLITVAFCLHSIASEQKILVIDPVGGLTQGPLEPLATSKGFFAITSINATQAALQRSTIGFDLADILGLYFTSKSRHTLDDDLSKRMDDIRRRRLSSKPVIDSLTPPAIAGDARIVKVSGRLQTTGAVNGRVFYDEPPFEIILVFRANSDLANRAAMPWLVDEIDMAVTADEIAKQRQKNRLK